jgi:ankyrin repeat protein
MEVQAIQTIGDLLTWQLLQNNTEFADKLKLLDLLHTTTITDAIQHCIDNTKAEFVILLAPYLVKGIGPDEMSSFEYALHKKNFVVAQAMIDSGFNINSVGKTLIECTGNTKMQIPAIIFSLKNTFCDDLSALEFVLNNKTTLDITYGTINRTALLKALRYKNYPAVHMLLDKGANPKVKNAHGRDAIGYCDKYCSCDKEWKEIKEKIFSKYDVSTLGGLIEREIRKGNLHDADRLRDLNLKEDVEIFSVIIECIKLDKLSLIKLVVTDFNSFFDTLLKMSDAYLECITNERIEILNYFLEHGAKIDWYDFDNWTLLHLAARHGKMLMAKFLISAGLNIDATSQQNNTPLTIAIVYSRFDVAGLLLDNKANIKIESTSFGNILRILKNVNCADDQLVQRNELLARLELMLAELHPKKLMKITNIQTRPISTISDLIITKLLNKDVASADKLKQLDLSHTMTITDAIQYCIDTTKPEFVILLTPHLTKGIGQYGMSSFEYALHKKNFVVAQAMIDSRFNINSLGKIETQPSESVSTCIPPIIFAMNPLVCNDKLALEFVLNNKPNLDILFGDLKETALLNALRYSDYVAVRMLLDKGANPKAKNTHGLDAIDYCDKYCNNDKDCNEIKEKIFSKYDVRVLGGLIERETRKRNLCDVADLIGLNLKKSTLIFDVVIQCIRFGKLNLTKLVVTDFYSFSNFPLKTYEILRECVMSERTETLNYFLEHGVKIDWVDHENWTLLHLAAYHGRIQMVKFLINAGSDIDARTNQGNTSLLLAFRSSCFDIVELLLDNKANIEIESTAFGNILAICKDNKPMKNDYLLDKWSKLVARLGLMMAKLNPQKLTDNTDIQTRPIVTIADLLINKLLHNAIEFTDKLKQLDLPHTTTITGAIQHCVDNTKTEFVILLAPYLTKGIGQYNMSSFEYALHKKNFVVAQAMIDSGFDINSLGKTKLQPPDSETTEVPAIIFVLARVFCDDESALEFVLNNEPNLNTPYGDIKETALLNSLRFNDYIAANLLLDEGADFKIKNKNEMDAIDYCNKYGTINRKRDEFKEKLFSKYDVSTLGGLIERETRKGNHSIVTDLKSLIIPNYSSTVYRAVNDCIRTDKLKVIELLVSDFNSFFKSYQERFDALQLCVHFKRINILDYFLKHGANINLIDSEGWNLLFFTSAFESIEMTKFLIENKINVNAKSKRRFNTSLIFAIKDHCYDSAELLLDNGADITHKSIDYGDALKVCKDYIPQDAALKNQHDKLFKRLELIKAKMVLAEQEIQQKALEPVKSPKPIDDSKMCTAPPKAVSQSSACLHALEGSTIKVHEHAPNEMRPPEVVLCTCINYKGREIKFPDDPLIEMFWDINSGIKPESAKYTLHDFGGNTRKFKKIENGKWVDTEFTFPKCQIQSPNTMKIKCHVIPAGLYGETEILVRFNDFSDY